MSSYPKINIAIGDILCSQSTISDAFRHSPSKRVIDLVIELRNGTVHPSDLNIVVFQRGEQYWCVDGHRRMSAIRVVFPMNFKFDVLLSNNYADFLNKFTNEQNGLWPEKVKVVPQILQHILPRHHQQVRRQREDDDDEVDLQQRQEEVAVVSPRRVQVFAPSTKVISQMSGKDNSIILKFRDLTNGMSIEDLVKTIQAKCGTRSVLHAARLGHGSNSSKAVAPSKNNSSKGHKAAVQVADGSVASVFAKCKKFAIYGKPTVPKVAVEHVQINGKTSFEELARNANERWDL